MSKNKSKPFLEFLFNSFKSQETGLGIIKRIQLFFSLIKDVSAGEYKGLSKKNIFLGFLTIVYIVSPIDLIPDVPIIGWMDDLTLFSYFLTKVNDEVEKYSLWKDSNLSTIEVPSE